MAKATKVKIEEETPNKGAWIDALYNGVGGFIHVETADGIRRHGRLTGIRADVIQVNNKKTEIPRHIELNGDPSDLIDIWRLTKINIG